MAEGCQGGRREASRRARRLIPFQCGALLRHGLRRAGARSQGAQGTALCGGRTLLAASRRPLFLPEPPQPRVKLGGLFHSGLAETPCFPKPALHVAARCVPQGFPSAPNTRLSRSGAASAQPQARGRAPAAPPLTPPRAARRQRLRLKPLPCSAAPCRLRAAPGAFAVGACARSAALRAAGRAPDAAALWCRAAFPAASPGHRSPA